MNLMYAQMGMKALDGWASFATSRIDVRLAQATQAYQNTMSSLSAAASLNSVGLNEIEARDQATRVSQELQVTSLQQEGAADVSAAAAGVAGRSVDSVIAQLRNTAASANHARLTNLRNQYRVAGQERRNVLLAKAYNKDISVIPKPSAASALLGIGASLLDVWDSHQTPDETISGRLSRL